MNILRALKSLHKHIKRNQIAALVAIAFGGLSLTSAHAATLATFNPDGQGNDAVTISFFDWAPNSALISSQAGGVQAIPISPGETKNVQVYGHSALIGVGDPAGDPLNLPGLNIDYEITFYLSNGASVVANGDGTEVLFDLDTSAGTNFVEIVYDDLKSGGVKGSSLAGLGYNDGELILSGQVVELSGNFKVPSNLVQPLDQYISDDWPDTSTVTGEGAQSIAVLVQYVNKAFFPSGVDKGTILPFNNSQVVPFRQTNPSRSFDTDISGSKLNSLVGLLNGVAGPDMLLQIDANNAVEFLPPEQACRVTGGGNDTSGIPLEEDAVGWDGTVAQASVPPTTVQVPVGKSNKTKSVTTAGYEWTMGGQAGANTALQPQPKGEWEHNNHVGPEGLQFAFHGGTSSGGPGTEIDQIICTDEGWCKQARPAPNKQIDFVGIGEFSNFQIDDTSYAGDGIHTFPGIGDVVAGTGGCKPGNGPQSCNANPGPATGTYHWFQVHIEDLGEPGNKPEDGAVCPPNGSGNNPFANPPVVENVADCGCADFYRITIYKGFDPVLVDGEVTGVINKTDKIYEVWGYLDGGNFQIHPLTGFDLK